MKTCVKCLVSIVLHIWCTNVPLPKIRLLFLLHCWEQHMYRAKWEICKAFPYCILAITGNVLHVHEFLLVSFDQAWVSNIAQYCYGFRRSTWNMGVLQFYAFQYTYRSAHEWTHKIYAISNSLLKHDLKLWLLLT